MRRLHRPVLELDDRVVLHRYAQSVSSVTTARESWSLYRASVKSQPVSKALEKMAGKRQRCAYCSDSHASDIDHFKPIAKDYTGAFKWKNLLWVCTNCNRRKSTKFPVDEFGDPLLLDPSLVDPWRHLTLDTDTGFISPRYIASDFDPVGEATLEVLPTINFEAVAEGRGRTCKAIRRAIKSVCMEPGSESCKELLGEVAIDDVGVSRWYGFWEGSYEPEMAELRAVNPHMWKRFLRACIV